MSLASAISDQQVAVTILRDTLLANPLKTLVMDSGGHYKIFWEHVEEKEALPYICIAHISSKPDIGASGTIIINHIYKVYGSTADMVVASNLDNFIDKALHRVEPVLTSFTDVTAISDIRKTLPVFDRYVVQGLPIFEVGGLFQIQLQLC